MNASVIDRSNDLLSAVRIHSKGVNDVLSDPRDESIIPTEYVNLSRLPDSMPTKVHVVADALSSDLLDPHVVELASSGDIVSPTPNTHYYEEDLLDHDLTEDDKKLAAALVAVQLVQQQKQSSLLAAELLGGKPIPLSHFTTSAIDKPTMGMVTSYIHSFDETTQSILDPQATDRNKVFQQAPPPLVPEDIDLKISKSINMKDDLDVSLEEHSIDEIDSDYEIEGVLKSSRRSLPHKKRIPRKLKTQPQKSIHSNFYKCVKCGDTFSNQSEYFNHRSQHTNPSKKIMFSCEICAAQFCNQIKFFEHLKSHYEPKNNLPSAESQSDEIFNCTNDDQGNSLGTIVKTTCPQTRKADGDSSIACEICGRVFKRQKAYESHKATVHVNNEEFSEPEDMMEGIRHVVNSQTASADDDSEEKFKSWRLSDDGMSSDCCVSHQDEPPESEKGGKKKKVSQCPHCARVFLHRNSLIYHIKSHSGLRPHQCDVCGKRFFAANALRVHLRMHSGDKPYKCEACGRRFRQWGDLKYHVISLHSNQKQYQCEFCGKDFARKYSLIVHRRIHTGEKNYVCEYCHKTFRASSYLMNHRRIHTGEKPYSCDVCQKPFRVKSDMKRHRSTHLKHTDRANQEVEITNEDLPIESESILPETTTPLNLNMRNDSTDSLSYSRDIPNTLYVWLPANGESILSDE